MNTLKTIFFILISSVICLTACDMPDEKEPKSNNTTVSQMKN